MYLYFWENKLLQPPHPRPHHHTLSTGSHVVCWLVLYILSVSLLKSCPLTEGGYLPANPSHAKKWEGRIYKSVGFSFVAIAGKINESIWQEEFLKKTTIFNSKPDAAEGLQCRFPGVWLEGSLSQWEGWDWEQAGQVVPLCAKQLEHSSKVFSDQSVFTWVQVSVSTPSSTANWKGPLLYTPILEFLCSFLFAASMAVPYNNLSINNAI